MDEAAPNATNKASVSQPATTPKRDSRLSWLWPIPIGMVLGFVVLPGLVNGPGDPSGYYLGTGFGGCLGFFVAIFLRMVSALDE